MKYMIMKYLLYISEILIDCIKTYKNKILLEICNLKNDLKNFIKK